MRKKEKINIAETKESSSEISEKSKPSPVSLISPAIDSVKGIIELFKGLIDAAKHIRIEPFIFLIITALCCAYNISHPDNKR